MDKRISINKRMLWQYVNRKINGAIHNTHVFSVICIMFDELFEDLMQGKEIKITNFGTLKLKEMKPRRYHNVRSRSMVQSEGHNILRFTLFSKIRTKICEYLDLDQTFGMIK